MSKAGNTILLLSYLKNGRKYSLEELAEKLEVTKRMVRSYKSELEHIGFYIETIRGPYGGYILKSHINLPIPTWKETDLEILRKIQNQNKEIEEELTRIIEKMKICMVQKENPIPEQEKKWYNLFSKACKEKYKVKITYFSLNKGITKRIIHPYELFYFQNGWGITAFCEQKQDLRNFEISRIKEAKILKEKF